MHVHRRRRFKTDRDNMQQVVRFRLKSVVHAAAAIIHKKTKHYKNGTSLDHIKTK
jgi:hypothetical protein